MFGSSGYLEKKCLVTYDQSRIVMKYSLDSFLGGVVDGAPTSDKHKISDIQYRELITINDSIL